MTEAYLASPLTGRSSPGLRLPRPARAVIFDMDGLLVDTEALFRDAMLAATADVGHEMPLALFLEMLGLPYREGVAIMTRHFGEGFPFEAWRAALVTRGRALRASGVALKAGVLELLDLLEARGIPRAIATSSGHTKVVEQLAPSGLLPRFQAVIARGDYENGKPSPDPFLVAAARLGVEPEHCIALEDSHNGVRAAHAAGMMTIMVPDLLAATDEMRGLCCMVIETLLELRCVIETTDDSGPPIGASMS